MQRAFLVCWIAFLASCIGTSRNLATRPPIQLEPCRPAKLREAIRCGILDVPEDRDRPQGRRLQLNVMLLPARAKAKAADALFVLAGGPGQAATDNLDFYAEIFDSLRADRDIVLLDQRGTSGPQRLGCDVYTDSLAALLGERFSAAAARRCVHDLGGRADLRFYTSLDAVSDLEQARSALGYDRIDLFGTSYGTRVAMLYMRTFPDRVRGAILKGTASFDLSPAPDVERALDLLFEDCAAESACGRAFPNL